MALERPVLLANILTSSFACALDVSSALVFAVACVGVVGTDTFISGVAALGMLRDGVNGAEVGTIRDVVFVRAMGSF
jgi:hypothetical protein